MMLGKIVLRRNRQEAPKRPMSREQAQRDYEIALMFMAEQFSVGIQCTPTEAVHATDAAIYQSQFEKLRRKYEDMLADGQFSR